MAISKEKKHALVEKYVDLLSKSRAMFLTDYRGLTVAELTRIRRQVEEADASYIVVKNTLFRRALEQAGFPVHEDLLDGPLGVGIVSGEVPLAAKTMKQFDEELEHFSIKGGFLKDVRIDKAQVLALADIPPREELLAQLVARLQSPIAGLVNVLNGNIRGLVYVLQARVDQMKAAES